mgnify:CR=1 FL=1
MRLSICRTFCACFSLDSDCARRRFLSLSGALRIALRTPWLDHSRWVRARATRSAFFSANSFTCRGVITCSALKRTYRNAIVAGRDGVILVYLEGSERLIAHELAHQRPFHVGRQRCQTARFPPRVAAVKRGRGQQVFVRVIDVAAHQRGHDQRG